MVAGIGTGDQPCAGTAYNVFEGPEVMVPWRMTCGTTVWPVE